jgi:hypothetical protein
MLHVTGQIDDLHRAGIVLSGNRVVMAFTIAVPVVLMPCTHRALLYSGFHLDFTRKCLLLQPLFAGR